MPGEVQPQPIEEAQATQEVPLENANEMAHYDELQGYDDDPDTFHEQEHSEPQEETQDNNNNNTEQQDEQDSEQTTNDASENGNEKSLVSPSPTHSRTPSHSRTHTRSRSPSPSKVISRSRSPSPVPLAATIACGQTVTGTTVGAANNFGLSNTLYGTTSGDKAFSFTLSSPASVTFSGCASAFDTVFFVYDSTGKTYLDGSDDGCTDAYGQNTGKTILTTSLPAGSYKFVVDGYSGASGAFSVSMSCASSLLTYHGGPIIQNPNIHPVFWSQSVNYQSQLNSFYSAISTGPFMSFLSQYSTANYAIGNGQGASGVVCTTCSTSATISDSLIRATLTSLFDSGKLPVPPTQVNSYYYPIHFPSGRFITSASGEGSCAAFCAYHYNFVYNNKNIHYGVHPDLGDSGCNGGCGSGTVLENTFATASHEFAEAVTDPLPSSYGAWFNPSQGEIADYCRTRANVVLGDGNTYSVSQLFSNRLGTCVTPSA
jgi:hypothetical protein